MKKFAVYYKLDGLEGSVTVEAEDKRDVWEEFLGKPDGYILDGLSDSMEYDKTMVDRSKLELRYIDLEEL